MRSWSGAAVEQALSAAPEAPAAGEQAVEDSQAREALRSADIATTGEAGSGLRTVREKSFALQAGLWVDTIYRTDQPKRELVFGSEEHFSSLTTCAGNRHSHEGGNDRRWRIDL